MQHTLQLSFQLINWEQGKQDGGYIYPKDRGEGGNSATAVVTFKIQIGISKICNFIFKCYIFYQKLIE
jgi:hypothetical protein